MVDIRIALSRGRGEGLAADRWVARAAVAEVRLRDPALVVVDPHGALAPFEALTLEALVAAVDGAPDGAVIDATGARPWDDPLWEAVLAARPELSERAVILRPERHAGRWTPAIGEPTLEAAVYRVVAASAPLEDDGPALRRLVMEARTARAPELTVRLLRLAQHEVVHGTLVRARAALDECAAFARHRVQATALPEAPPEAAAEGDDDQARAHNQALHELAAVLDAYGDVCAGLDELAPAEASWAESADVSARLLALRPEVESRWGHAVSALRSARAAEARGRFDEAALAARRALDGTDPDNSERVAAVLQTVAAAELNRGEIEAAEEALTRAAERLDGLLASDPRRFDLIAERLDVALRTGQAALSRDDLDAAKSATEQATRLCDQLTRREPTRADWMTGVAATATLLGDLRLATGEIDAARIALLHADEVLSKILGRDPERRAATCEQARVHRRLVYALAIVADDERAEDYAARDATVTESLLASLPDAPTRRHDLALSLSARAWLAERRGRASAALWEQAAQHARQAIPSAPAGRRTLERAEDALRRLERAKDALRKLSSG